MGEEASLPGSKGSEQPGFIDRWQIKLLPVMVIVPAVLMIAFIALATIRMNKFERFVYSSGPSLYPENLPAPSQISTDSLSPEKLEYIKLFAFAQMEQYSMNKRYNQAGIITMSTVYTKYLAFFTGMILAIVGSVFIISKLKEDITSLNGGFTDNVKVNLSSSSPGIIFAVLGTVLMTIAIVNKGEVKVDDAPLYLNHYNFYKPGKQAGIDTSNIDLLPFNDSGKISEKEASEIDLSK